MKRFITLEYKSAVKEVLDDALRGTQTANFEFPLFKKNRERLEILLNATSRVDAQGKIVGVVGVGQDITDRKKVELELTRVAKDLQKLIDSANAPIFGIDTEGLVNEWNQKAPPPTAPPVVLLSGPCTGGCIDRSFKGRGDGKRSG